DIVYVLHCFNKKTQRTSHQDKQIAKVRLHAVLDARRG
ncbi:type II toxin-antitoxin system RelE/ParE family toxin, partial [Escherichia coli]|nr:type II toxin-antitoxin system RelE/ParE family toxin [Escherichia coli]